MQNLRYSLLGLFGLIAVGWWSYYPGLGGAFLFDDFKNLSVLGNYGSVDHLQSFLLYVTSGDADPIGRPIALLSFLLDANDWPANPGPFKYTNILLHLLNGMLLAWVLLRLGRHLQLKEPLATAGGILAALLWTLHPLWTSTVLYVVQREAMLPATFSLIGILMWISGRERLADGRLSGIGWLIAGAGGCTLLAMLSKANGILLPLLILTLEWAILARSKSLQSDNFRGFKYIRGILLGLPSIAIVLWLCVILRNGIMHGAATGWINPWLRLISEPRVLMDYLILLCVPRGSNGGLLNDDFPVSSDLIHPWTTLPAIIFIFALIAVGIRLRRRHPAVAAAVLFFFGGHLLESTVLPLELYFEHRNYLPAMLLFWPLALWLTAADSPMPRVRAALVLGIPCLLAALTHARAIVWGEPYVQAMLFEQASPHSPRAQMTAAYYHLANGHSLLAAYSFRKTMNEFPNEAVAALHLIEAECVFNSIDSATQDKILYALRNNFNEAGIIHYWMVKQLHLASSGKCRGFDLDFMERMLEAILENPHFSSDPATLRNVEYMRGRLALIRNDGDSALSHFNRSLSLDPTAGQAMEQAALLGEAQFPMLGLQHLAYFDSLPAPVRIAAYDMAGIHTYLLKHLAYQASQRNDLQMQLRQEAVILDRSAPRGTSRAAQPFSPLK